MQRPSRTRSKPSASFQRQLNMYALAASAAGVGMLALAQPAEARIVFKSAHKQIAPNNTIPLDLNGDGKTDFNFHDSFTCTSFCEYVEGALTVIPTRPANQILGHLRNHYAYASALPAGIAIGPKKPFSPGEKIMEMGGYDAGTTSVGFCAGDWQNAKNRYLGLRFIISGQVHYGWARLNVTCAKNGETTALLTGYAYETVANRHIITGKTASDANEPASPNASNVRSPGSASASLGALAHGTEGLSLWRLP